MATAKRDLYEILGLARGASDEEIRRAYRRLARQYHPDVNQDSGTELRFKEVNEAYEILSDPDKRQRYDAFGHAGVDATAGGGFSGGFSPFADLFESFFGTEVRRSNAGPSRGSDLRVEVEIDFLQAVFGIDRKVEVAREQLCSRCGGTGAEPGTKTSACDRCQGSGEVRNVQNTLFGRVVSSATCPKCHGVGHLVDTPCTKCRGAAREEATSQLTVTIPPGIDDGQQLRLTGEGEAGYRGGPPGNLYVLVRVRAHAQFQRRGSDIVYELAISPAIATLGAEVEVPTVDGSERVKVPAGTQQATILRLRGKGVPRLGSAGRGDELIVVNVVIPKKLSGHERKLWEELRSAAKESGGA